MRCTSTTLTGTQCTRKAMQGSSVCWQHARSTPAMDKTQRLPTPAGAIDLSLDPTKQILIKPLPTKGDVGLIKRQAKDLVAQKVTQLLSWGQSRQVPAKKSSVNSRENLTITQGWGTVF